MTQAWRKVWRLNILVILSLLAGMVGAFAGPAAAANNGIVISSGAKNHRPGIGISPDGSKVCTVWSDFDQSPNQTYARIYSTATDSWSPALSSSPVNISKQNYSVQGNTVRCAIDGAGRTHVVWVEYGAGKAPLRYAQLPAGADASVAANWTAPVTITSVGETWDSQNPDIASLFADASGAVWLSYWSLDNSGVYVRSWSAGGGWSASTKVSPSGGKHARIAVDNAGNVHVTYLIGGQGLRYSYRVGGVWTLDQSLPGGDKAVEQSGIAVSRGSGEVHIVFAADDPSCGGGDSCRVVQYVKRSGPTGSFSGPTTLTGFGNHVVARVAWSSTNKLLMVSDKRDVGVITYNTSDNNGASWNGASDLTDSMNAQWPAVAMDNVGNGYVVFWTGDDIRFVKIGNAPQTPPTPRCGSFNDVAQSDAACPAILALTQQNVIKGYATNPPTFGPGDPVQRAQVATFIVRGLNWGGKPTTPRSFSDFGPLVAELRTASLILANQCDQTGNCVAQGYDAAKCASLGVASPCFGPNDSVTYAQVISFITRAFEQDTTKNWVAQPTAAQPYTGVPAVHDVDVRTYNKYAGAIPSAPTTTADWSAAAPRAWVAQVLYQALQAPPGP